MTTILLYFTLATAAMSFLTSVVNFFKGVGRDHKMQEISVQVDGNLSRVREELEAARIELKELLQKSAHAEGVKEEKDRPHE